MLKSFPDSYKRFPATLIDYRKGISRLQIKLGCTLQFRL